MRPSERLRAGASSQADRDGLRPSPPTPRIRRPSPALRDQGPTRRPSVDRAPGGRPIRWVTGHARSLRRLAPSPPHAGRGPHRARGAQPARARRRHRRPVDRRIRVRRTHDAGVCSTGSAVGSRRRREPLRTRQPDLGPHMSSTTSHTARPGARRDPRRRSQPRSGSRARSRPAPSTHPRSSGPAASRPRTSCGLGGDVVASRRKRHGRADAGRALPPRVRSASPSRWLRPCRSWRRCASRPPSRLLDGGDDLVGSPHSLRRSPAAADERALDALVAVLPPARGMGHAIRDRLTKAATVGSNRRHGPGPIELVEFATHASRTASMSGAGSCRTWQS